MEMEMEMELELELELGLELELEVKSFYRAITASLFERTSRDIKISIFLISITSPALN